MKLKTTTNTKKQKLSQFNWRKICNNEHAKKQIPTYSKIKFSFSSWHPKILALLIVNITYRHIKFRLDRCKHKITWCKWSSQYIRVRKTFFYCASVRLYVHFVQYKRISHKTFKKFTFFITACSNSPPKLLNY